MLLPIEILNNIFAYSNNANIIVPFRNILSNNTIRHILDKDYMLKYTPTKNNILLFKIMVSIDYPINWDWLSCRKNLSEDFIREFYDKIYWCWVDFPNLSTEIQDIFRYGDLVKGRISLGKSF